MAIERTETPTEKLATAQLRGTDFDSIHSLITEKAAVSAGIGEGMPLLERYSRIVNILPEKIPQTAIRSAEEAIRQGDRRGVEVLTILHLRVVMASAKNHLASAGEPTEDDLQNAVLSVLERVAAGEPVSYKPPAHAMIQETRAQKLRERYEDQQVDVPRVFPEVPSLDGVEDRLDIDAAVARSLSQPRGMTGEEAETVYLAYGLVDGNPVGISEIVANRGNTSTYEVGRQVNRALTLLRIGGRLGVYEPQDPSPQEPRPVTDKQKILARLNDGEGSDIISEELVLDGDTVRRTVYEYIGALAETVEDPDAAIAKLESKAPSMGGSPRSITQRRAGNSSYTPYPNKGKSI